MSAPTTRIANQLLNGLPRAMRIRLLEQCEPVDLVFGTVLCEPEVAYTHVHFPMSGFISLVAPIHGHPPLEVGLIGDEGMLGATLALGVESVPLRGVVQGAGTALRLSTAQFRRALHDSPALLSIVDRYLFVTLAQAAQLMACVSFHDVEQRLALWLLLSHDRAGADTMQLTHQFLADMLGVQRSAVTIAAGRLQRQSLIHYTRGTLSVTDRPGLERAACACYAAQRADYAARLP